MVKLNDADAIYVGTASADTVYLGATQVWPGTSPPPSLPDNIGDSFLGGYYAGIIDTTTGNIVGGDASQDGLRYGLIVSPLSLQSSSKAYKTAASAAPAAASTRWDGLTASIAMNSATYPAAQYCCGLPHDDDGASAWYLPAIDELELLFRNFKATTGTNATGTTSGSTFPGVSQTYGYNPSSDPAGAAYTSSVPAQTTVAAFQSGGAQALYVASNDTYWSATDYDGSDAWVQAFPSSSSGNGHQNGNFKTNLWRVRPVRRLILT